MLRKKMNLRKIQLFTTMIFFSTIFVLTLPAAKPGVKKNIRDIPVSIHKTETPPVIDGKLDEPLWQQATRFDKFITFKPDYGKPASEKTTILMT